MLSTRREAVFPDMAEDLAPDEAGSLDACMGWPPALEIISAIRSFFADAWS